MSPPESGNAANRQDYTAETIKSVLPKQIRVDEKGVYWRDFGTHLSLCPHSTPPEGTRTLAVFVPEQDRSFLLQEVRQLEKERDRYRAALRKIACLYPWVPASDESALQEARRALGV